MVSSYRGSTGRSGLDFKTVTFIELSCKSLLLLRTCNVALGGVSQIRHRKKIPIKVIHLSLLFINTSFTNSFKLPFLLSNLSSVWITHFTRFQRLRFLSFFFFLFFFSFPARVSALGDKCTVHALLSTVHALFIGPTITLFRKKKY